jgi:hypothetical protein
VVVDALVVGRHRIADDVQIRAQEIVENLPHGQYHAAEHDEILA